MAMSSTEASFLRLNSSAIANSVSSLTAIYNSKTIATPPTGFPAIDKYDFEVYLNNRRVPTPQVTSIVQNGANIEVTLNVAAFLGIPGAELESDDEVLLIGKFN